MSGVLDKIEWTHLDFVRRFHFAVALCLVSAVVWLFAETVNLQSVFFICFPYHNGRSVGFAQVWRRRSLDKVELGIAFLWLGIALGCWCLFYVVSDVVNFWALTFSYM